MKLTKLFLFIILTGLVSLIIAYPLRHRIKKAVKYAIVYFNPYKNYRNSSCPGCEVFFVDNVKTHEEAYKKDGIMPQKSKTGLKKLVSTGKLKIINSNDFYIVNNLKHSNPYLMPKAVLFLNDLSKTYKKKCIKKSIPFVPFRISSLTRTKTDVSELMKSNGNAISNSSHLKGKTFDINYHSFNNNKKQIGCFIESLKEFRMRNRCFVKFERNGCLHITVN